MATPTPIVQSPLPTLDKLNATIPPKLDAKKIAAEWLDAFAVNVKAGDVKGILSLFVPDAYWRDMLALTCERDPQPICSPCLC